MKVGKQEPNRSKNSPTVQEQHIPKKKVGQV